jgi:predicted HAD superfamily Cof-like phosphohydrolase
LSHLRDVCKFHGKFRIGYEGPPRLLDPELKMFRLKFQAEELAELARELGVRVTIEFVDELDVTKLPEDEQKKRRAGALDALVDMEYVQLGTAHLMGFAGQLRSAMGGGVVRYEEAWDRVHDKNMEKERGQSRARDFSDDRWDVMKPEGWTPPDHSDLV